VAIRGNVVDGFLSGRGEIIWPNGQRFVSDEFRKGNLKVRGTLYLPDGQHQEAVINATK
jgi:hypothetical protein